MTISSTTNTVSYTGNGSTTAFAVPYAFFGTGTTSEIQVVEVVIATGAETVKSNGSDYTVAGGSGATGTVTAATAPASTVKWVINRATAQTQETDYVENDPFPAESHEEALDRLTAIDQEQQRALDRTAQLPDGYTGSFDPTLPVDITGSTVLAFNAGATAFEIGPTTSAISGAAAAAAAAASSATDSANSATASAASAATASAYAGTQTVDLFDGTGSQTAFTLSVAPANGDENNTDVHISGVYQQKNTYSLSGTTLTFSAAPPSGTGNVEVMHMSQRAIETPADGSVTYPKFASGLVDTDLSAVSGSDDTIASAKAIKTYVDAQIGSNNELSEVLANGNTSGGTDIVVSAGDSITTDTIAETTAAAGVTIDGVLVKDGQVDGRDVSVDGTKLDTIETNADVTDTANVTAAGALMDSELTNITAVKALNQGVATTDSPSFAGLTATTADINGGTIDGAVIGGASAAAGTFTTITTTGNIGVGISPAARLHIKQAANSTQSGFRTERSDTTAHGVVYMGGDNNLYIQSQSGGMNFYSSGSAAASFAASTGNFQMNNAAGPALLNEAASSTNPTHVPNKADPDTGMGWVSADIGALVAGGSEAARFNATGLGVGGVSPSFVLDVRQSGATAAQAMRVADSTPTEYFGIFNANNGGDTPNAANATMKVRGMSGTSRSINAGGTVNASGADYAEYMRKADGCGDIAKGDVCGVDANGLLTDKFDDAVAFVVKSTNPAYVGGDVWSKSGEVDADGNEIVLEGDALEAARHTVDRIAFSGQVPCNTTGPAQPSDYVVAERGVDGGIIGVCVTDPTFEQYRKAVGQVWKILEDGRPFIAVKIS